jgi:hypothetical protein
VSVSYTCTPRWCRIVLASLTHVVQSADAQKASFYAVWDGINDLKKRVLIHVLQILVDMQSQVGEEGDEGAKAELLSEMDYDLRYNASTEHATKVSQFMNDLESLSAEAVREMLSMTEPGPTVFVVHEAAVQEGNGHDNEDTSTITTVASTAVSTVASTVSTVTGTISTAASTVSTVASTAESERIASL